MHLEVLICSTSKHFKRRYDKVLTNGCKSGRDVYKLQWNFFYASFSGPLYINSLPMMGNKPGHQILDTVSNLHIPICLEMYQRSTWIKYNQPFLIHLWTNHHSQESHNCVQSLMKVWQFQISHLKWPGS